MCQLRTIGSAIRRFGLNQAGTIAVTLAIAAIPIFTVVGVATDFIRASAVKARLQSTLDAAALGAAASKNLSDPERIAFAEALFAKNWDNDGITAKLKVKHEFSVVEGAVNGTASMELPTALMQIAGIKTMDVGSDVTVTIPEEKKAEIVLVLDYSGSMMRVTGGKVEYVAMRDAATKLIDDLVKDVPDKIKVGLVPFSHHVYVTLPKQYVVGQTGTGNWTGCTQDRMYPYNTEDSTPTANDETKWGYPQAPAHIDYGCDAYAPNHLKILPLTSDITKATDQLAIMQPYFWTHIALGVEFGFHLLSPNAPFGQGAAYGDRQTEKFMVVLTDGEQTEEAFGPGGARTVPQGEANLEMLCDAAKDKGIVMITVAFDLQDKPTRDRLSGCSSDSSKYFFIAEDDAELANAFDDIKNQITQQVFVSK